MGKLHSNYILKFICWCLLVVTGWCLFVSEVRAQTCALKNPATEVQTSVGEYGAARDGGARSHRGVDIMIPMCVPVPNQTIGSQLGGEQPCTVVPNGQSPLHKTGGYGLYVRYNCGPRIEVRYAHLNGWTAGMPSNGRSGAAKSTPPHVHYEVIITPPGSASGGRKVDPQCVWGEHPSPSKCCIGVGGGCNLGHSPANMCNETHLNQLFQNAGSRGYGSGLTTSKPVQPGRPPESFPATAPEKDEPQCEDKEAEKPVEQEHDGVQDLEANPQPVAGSGSPPSGGGGGSSPPPAPQPPPEYADPPPENNPGNPGSDPDLTPQPPPGKEAEGLSGCATDTWTAMVNQAVMEARREDLLNKRFIVKPDSVLDYGCFDMMKQSVAQNAGPIFSETKRWANLPVNIIGKVIIIQRELGSQSLDAAIYSIVDKSLARYKSGQFGHPFLAGSAPVSASAGQSSCNVMAQVWQAAKCKNFDDTKVFYRFEDLVNQDPREYPENMKCN